MDEHTLDDHLFPLADEWQVGERVADQYEITDVHRGGMGVVYRARHLGWDVDVAIKRPRPELFHAQADRDRFVREARTWVDLGLHPHVCNCHYVRAIGDVPSVVAEYVEGGSLADWIRDRRLYAGSDTEVLARILDVAVQSAWGLAHAHELGVVHRDVKPANILVGSEVKVTDFGLAGAAAGSYRGTRHYASPEQAAGEVTDARGDVWSFAVSVLQMVTGEITWLAGPAAGEALGGLAVQRGLAALLASCLEWEPANRPATMADVAAALVELHTSEVGPYLRQPASSAVPRADELNNRALSLLDLGHDAEAGQLLDEALIADPRHPEATFNSGVLRWRAGKTPDDAVLTDLKATDPQRAGHLIDLVHAERGDTPPDFTIPVEPHPHAAPLSVTPNGEFVLIGNAGAVRVVRVATGECVRVLTGHPEAVKKIAVSSDGTHALTASMNWTVALWHLPTGRLVHTRYALKMMADALHLDLAADAGLVMTTRFFGDFDLHRPLRRDFRTVRVWRLDSRRPARKLRLRSDVSTIRVSPDGRRALVGQNDGVVRVWDLTTGTSLFSLAGHAAPVSKIDIGAHRAVTAVNGLAGSDDYTARVWDLRTGRCEHVLTGHTAPLTSIRVTPDGQLALTGSGDLTARLWDLSTGACLRVLTGHANVVTSVSLPGNAPRLAVTTELSGAVRIWDLAAGRCLRTITDAVDTENNVLLTPDGQTLVHAGRDAVRLWRITPTTPSPLQLSRSRAAAALLAVSEQVTDLLARAEQHPEHALDLVRQARDLPGHERSPEVMKAWRRLPSARRAFRTAWLTAVLDGGTDALTGVCTTQDGHVLSVGHQDNAVWVWDLSTGNRVTTLTGHTERLLSVCASGPFVAAGAVDGTVRVWRSGRPTHTLRGHDGPVKALCSTPDSRHLVTGGEDTAVRVWELDSGRLVHVLEGHTGAVTAVATTPDGRFGVTIGRNDQSVRQWDLATGRFTHFLETYRSESLHSVSVTPDGLLLTVGRLSRRGVRVRELSSHRFVRYLGRDNTNLTMSSVCTSTDGSVALVTESAEAISVWEVATGHSLGRLEDLDGGVNAICFTPDDNHILIAGQDGKLRVWDIDWDLHAPDEGESA